MNFVAVDVKGTKIKSDILVSGYIRKQIMEKFKIYIPMQIIELCFLFWYIDTCDKWDKLLCHELVQIDYTGSCVKLDDNIEWTSDRPLFCTIFGCNSIKSGDIFTWKLRFNSNIYWCCIGIIHDKIDILKSNINDNNFGRQNSGCFLTNTHGAICYEWERKENYCPKFGNKGVIIEMTLNMNQHTIKYKINNIDYGIVYDKLYKNAYKLAVCMSGTFDNEEIELL